MKAIPLAIISLLPLFTNCDSEPDAWELSREMAELSELGNQLGSLDFELENAATVGDAMALDNRLKQAEENVARRTAAGKTPPVEAARYVELNRKRMKKVHKESAAERKAWLENLKRN